VRRPSRWVASSRGSLAVEREWLLERLATKPDVTLRGLVAELGERRGDELRLGVADRARGWRDTQKRR